MRLTGRIDNENRAPVAGARLTLLTPAGRVLQNVTDVQGEFYFELRRVGDYQLTIEREGYFPVRIARTIAETGSDIQLRMERVREVHESVEVTAAPPAIDMDTTTSHQGVSGTDIVNIPYPNTNDFRASLRIIPGIVRDQKGGIHVNGGAEDQVMYTLNGFNITDPLTGRFDSRLSVESVQSVQLASGNLAAEYGKGSAGTLAVETRAGDDKLRYGGTNFVPGVESRKGIYIGNWTPRFNLSGPIRRGRAWLSNSVDIQYVKTVIEDLPRSEDRNFSWRLSNLLSGQVNLTPSHILHAGLLFGLWTAPRTGLGPLDPIETTVDRRSRQWFFHIKDQHYLSRRAVIEFGYAANRTFGREIPQGHQLLGLTPYGKRGNFFLDATRKASRDQFIVNAFLPAFRAAGSHQLKSGIDLDHVGYWQNASRTGFENFNEAGVRLRRTMFAGSGLVQRTNDEVTAFVQDSWRIHPSLLVELGLRGDWDRILSRWDASPRLGVAWSPQDRESTKFYGGFARVFDAANLRLFTRPQDQYTLSSYFLPEGAMVRGPAVSLFSIRDQHLSRPRYLSWNAGVEQRLGAGTALRVEYLRRRGQRGFTYLNLLEGGSPPPPEISGEFPGRIFDAVYELSNHRRDKFDSVAFTVRQAFRRQYEWTATYTRSRALSNAVVDINSDEPLTVLDNAGRMPWDAPHRLVGWGYLPTPFKDWALACLVDTRTGYPFSAFTDAGTSIGQVNSHRFPAYFELNLHLEKRFNFRHYRWAFRMGANNLTNRRNPDTVNNIVTSSRYLQFLGGSGRAFNFRIRWLGKL